MNAIHADLNRRAAMASIAVATLLAGLKIWAVVSTGSVAMLGSLADTALDLVASLATLVGYQAEPVPPTRSSAAVSPVSSASSRSTLPARSTVPSSRTSLRSGVPAAAARSSFAMVNRITASASPATAIR